MTRVTRGFVAKRRRKKTHPFYGRFRIVKQKCLKAKLSTYRDRRLKKREFRRMWISRINAFVRTAVQDNSSFNRVTYNKFIYALKKNNIILNRKTLSQLSCISPKELSDTLTYCCYY